MVIVGKHVNSITINILEYLLYDDGKIMEFASEEEAKAFLKEKGLTDDEIYWLVFETVPASNEKKDFMEAYERISKLKDLLSEAQDLFDSIPPAIQEAIFYSLQ